MMENIVTLTNEDGYCGSAKIKWIPENRWSAGHYEAFICVPFQDAKWANLFVWKEENVAEATEKAKEYLNMALSRCTLFG